VSKAGLSGRCPALLERADRTKLEIQMILLNPVEFSVPAPDLVVFL